jgi:hypothetical protein
LYEGDTFVESSTDLTTLGPDTTKPGITINSDPPAGSRVEPGDEILIDSTAQENRNGPSWQEGLQTFQLTANPGGQVGEPQEANSALPQPCGRKQWSLATQGTYEVPEDAPPIVEICGIAEDFAGNIQTTCNKYYTGEVWEGTTNSTVTTLYGGGPCGNPVHVKGKVQLVVAEDGSVAGTFDVTGCGVSQPHGEITGTATDEGFVFPQFVVYTNGSLIPKVSPTHAEATLTNMQGPAVTWVTTWDLTCVTCA